MAIEGENQPGFRQSGMDVQYEGGLGEKVQTEQDLAIAAQMAGNYDRASQKNEALPATTSTNEQEENTQGGD